MKDEKNLFIALGSRPDPEETVFAKYYIEPKGTTLLEAAKAIAEEESIGTWTEVKTLTDFAKSLAAKVISLKKVNENSGIAEIAYPLDLFDIESGIPSLLSIVAGNLFGLKSLANVRLVDIELPKAYVEAFKGPKFGIEGVRSIVGTLKDRRPHLGTIVKPKVGLNPKETAEVAYKAARGGVDLIKDDETLTNQKFCPLEDRVTQVMEALDRVKEETGRTVLYAVNITAEYEKALKYAEIALDNGANCIMIDVLTAGFTILRRLAEDSSIKVPIHVHRTMHAALTRNPKHGISMKVIAKLVRLCGGDQLHTGTAAGKMERRLEEVVEIDNWLRLPWYHIKTVFPVASGGIHPALVPINIRLLGTDIVINAGGGIHGHPLGTEAGAKAMRQAIEAVMKGIPLREYAKSHEELRIALEHWGEKYAYER